MLEGKGVPATFQHMHTRFRGKVILGGLRPTLGQLNFSISSRVELKLMAFTILCASSTKLLGQYGKQSRANGKWMLKTLPQVRFSWTGLKSSSTRVVF
jgi:hypothetical protein